jgi:hypothetical protein
LIQQAFDPVDNIDVQPDQVPHRDSFALLQQRQQELFFGHKPIPGVIGQINRHCQHTVSTRRQGGPLADRVIARADFAPDQVAHVARFEAGLQ